MYPSSSFIGVAIACGGNILISLALTVQKLAHRRQSEELSSQTSPQLSKVSSPRSRSSDNLSLPAQNETSPSRNSSSNPKITTNTIPILVVPSSPPQRQSSSSSSSPSDAIIRIVEPPSSLLEQPSVPESISQTLNGQSKLHSKSKTDPEDHHDEDEDDDSTSVEEGAYLKSKLWWLGLGLICIGEGGNFLSYGFAPASVVAPLGTVALIANCVFAPLILGEKFKLRDLIGVGLAIIGAVTVVWASNDTNPRLGPSELIKAISQPIFIGYTIVTFILVIILMFLSRLPRWGGHYVGIDIGICALFGGYTVLSTKALSSFLSRMFLRSFEYKITWVLVAVLVGTSVFQIKYLNKALMRFESKEVIPTQFVFFSLAAIIGSAVLYQEFRDVAFTRLVNFVFGIVTTFLGVHLLTSSFSRDSDSSENEEENQSITGNSQHRNSLTRALSITLDENTPLLISSPLSPSLAVLARSTSSSTSPHHFQFLTNHTNHTNDHNTLPTINVNGGLPPKIKLARQTSGGNLTTSLGNSQAGFLLLATTPPGTAATIGVRFDHRKRERSRSRGGGDDEESGR